jgi:hypothetical protein
MLKAPGRPVAVSNAKVTQKTISKTICVKAGRTRSGRRTGTNALKVEQLALSPYADQNPSHYEEDRLISLELGGAPRSKRNLWPEPWSQAHKGNARETAWKRRVCNGTLTLKQAQKLELAYTRGARLTASGKRTLAQASRASHQDFVADRQLAGSARDDEHFDLEELRCRLWRWLLMSHHFLDRRSQLLVHETLKRLF